MCDVESIESDMRVALFSIVIGFISVLSSGYGQSLQEYPIYEDFENDEAAEDPMAEPDYDGMNIPIAKRFGSFFDQRARERYLMGKSPSPPARNVAEPAKVKRQGFIKLFSTKIYANRPATSVSLDRDLWTLSKKKS